MKKKYSLVGVDGNAYGVMAYVKSALKEEGREKNVEDYIKEATSGDYDNLLCVSMKYIDIANGD